MVIPQIMQAFAHQRGGDLLVVRRRVFSECVLFCNLERQETEALSAWCHSGTGCDDRPLHRQPVADRAGSAGEWAIQFDELPARQ